MKSILRLIFVIVWYSVSAGIMPAAGQEQPNSPSIPFMDSGKNSVFLPLIAQIDGFYKVSGQVSDDHGNPLVGVEISNGAGVTTTTSVDGSYNMFLDARQSEYSFSPEKTEMGFTPSAVDITVDGSIQNLDFTGMSGCGEGIENGGFETNNGWELQNAVFSTEIVNSGSRSLHLGPSGSVNLAGSSIATSEIIQIPAEAKDPLLRMWLYTRAITSISDAPSKPTEKDSFFGPDEDQKDLQAVQVVNTNDQLLETLWEANGANTQEWGLVQYNLYKYSGQSIKIRFVVQNDGAGSISSLFVDDISLQTCPTIFAPEDYDQNTVATSAINACTNQIVNSGFETSIGWGIPYTAYSAGYVYRHPNPGEVYLGNWAMRTGIPVYYSYQNRYSYSDFWQTVYIPASSVSAKLTLYNKMINPSAPAAQDSEAEQNLADKEPEFSAGKVWMEGALAGDRMYILVLNPNNGTILRTLAAWDGRSTNWKPREYDLSDFRGRNIRIQIGTYNDGWGGVQSMYVDEVYVKVCDSIVPPPPPPATSCPSGYSERLINNSFESSGGWYRPVTAYTAGYTNSRSHTGLRSMRTGITNIWHNRYSYSDFGQMTVVPYAPAHAVLKFYAYLKSGDNRDRQYLLVLNNWGYWIDTLLWKSGTNIDGWVEVTRDLTYKPYNGWPIRLQWGTYNNGWGGVTSMFVDDVTLCTYP